MDTNKIIKKQQQPKEDEKNDTETPEQNEQNEQNPIEITEQVKNKMLQIMDKFITDRDKLTEINQTRKELKIQTNEQLKELETLMKLYGLQELVKGSNKFVLNKTIKQIPLKKAEFKNVLTFILKDTEKVDQIYETANQMKEQIVVEKIKCLKNKQNKQNKQK